VHVAIDDDNRLAPVEVLAGEQKARAPRTNDKAERFIKAHLEERAGLTADQASEEPVAGGPAIGGACNTAGSAPSPSLASDPIGVSPAAGDRCMT